MKRSCLLLALCAAFPSIARATETAPAIEWQAAFGGAGYDRVESVVMTSDGGYLLGGYSRSGVSGDKTSANNGGSDYWVVRLDAGGAKLWERSLGGTGNDFLTSLGQTSDGGYLLGGYSWSGEGGDKSSANYGAADFWVVRLDANGDELWERSFGGTGFDGLSEIRQTADGGYVLGGYSSSGASGNKTGASYGSYDYWVVRLDDAGDKLWERSFGGSSEDVLYSLRQTSDGGFVLGGYSSSSSSGNKTSASYGMADYWVLRLDAGGDELWERSFGGWSHDFLTDLEQTSDGGYVLGGYSISEASENKTSARYGSYDYWVLRLDADGDELWERSFGGTSNDYLTSLRQTADGGYLLGGSSTSGVSGSKTSAGWTSYYSDGRDFWAVRLDADGGELWQRSFGGTAEDWLSDVGLTSDGGYLLGGYSDSAANGNKTSAGYGGGDFWVVKLAGVTDSDSDGVPDAQDVCAGYDDADDADLDGVPAGCDLCPADFENDADVDGWCESDDNCADAANEGQDDADGDGTGDVCEPDSDGDGIIDDDDAFPLDPTYSADADADGVADELDACEGWDDGLDGDGDGVPDGDGLGACDICPDDAENDADVDGWCESEDNCADVANEGQDDADADGIGDACEPDTDGDGVIDDHDAFPDDPDETADTDGDGVGDNADAFPDDASESADTDADGIGDGSDACPTEAATGFDADADGCLDDTDGDGLTDDVDLCPSEDAAGFDLNDDGCLDDTDGDGFTDDLDACPGFDDLADDDGDFVADGCDACPGDALNDQDGDGLCTAEDLCPLDSSAAGAIDDADGDTVCDHDDLCPDGDDLADEDADELADACDACPADAANDADADGVCGDVDACLGDDRVDPDGDGVPSACDTVCPDDPTNDADLDGVCGLSDVCPLDYADDSDGDGSCDRDDVCPDEDDFLDTDGDGVVDCQDSCPDDVENDGDGDGLCESADNCWGVANPDQADADGDGVGNVCEPDSDGDGVIDDTDVCDLVADPLQADQDGDGQGDACDADDDGDGVHDGADTCAATPAATPVLATTGCSIDQTCPTSAAWKNHGAYVSCVSGAAGTLVAEGDLTTAQKDAIVSAAARSRVGKR